MIRNKKQWLLNAGLALLAAKGTAALAQETMLPQVLPSLDVPTAQQGTTSGTIPITSLNASSYQQLNCRPYSGHGSVRANCRQFKLDHCWGYLSEYEPTPFGQALYTVMKTQVDNGEAARMMLYRCDFVDGKDVLNQHGRDRMLEIMQMAPQNFYPIIIERTDNPALAEARKLAVLREMAQGSFPVAAERVFVGAPTTRGLSGWEGDLLTQKLLNYTFQGFPVINSGSFRVSNQGR